jgi:hypothetical protein
LRNGDLQLKIAGFFAKGFPRDFKKGLAVMGANALRAFLLGLLVAVSTAGAAQSQTNARPPVSVRRRTP